ncbi:MAG TPA: condensation domain-containing protein, partial [Chloroflexota bacterium]|nr:condensation domain-containing protein [Chloroflexota bacterium]
EPGSGAHNLPAAVRLEGPLDVDVLARALDALVARHEALRTTFAAAEGRPEQVVAPALAVPLPVDDLGALPPAAREAAVAARARAEAGAPFDLAAGPLLRAALLRLGPAEHVLLLTLHHVVADGWSMDVLLRELSGAYAAISRGEAPALPALPVQYGDYAAWQRGWLRGDALEGQLAYWRAALAGLPEALDLPTDHPYPAQQTFAGGRESIDLPADLMARLVAAGRRQGATPYMVILAAFQALLGRYSGQTDLAVGTPVAGRPRPELEGLIGFFVNTLVLRADLSANPTVREHLARVREACLGAQAHQDVPFERLVEELRPQRDLSRNPLFQAMFVYEPAPAQPLSFPGLEAQALDPPAGVARFDLTLVVTERAGGGGRGAGPPAGWPGGSRASLEYRSDLFEAPTVRRMLGHLTTLLQGFVSTPEGRLDDLPLLPPAERRQLLVDWNATALPYAHDVPFHHLFARHAAEAPHAVAAVFEGQSLTYGALDARANRLAHYLRRLGVGPEVRVALCVERSLDQVVGLLGILKAGGVYVPLDPAYPAARLSYMLEDAGAPVLLTQQRVVEALPPHSGRVVCLDADWATIAAEPDSDPGPIAGPGHGAYVIYTSGSTGRPKGVQLEHGGLASLIAAQVATFGLGPGDRVLQFFSLSFDGSVFEMVWALAVGATLYLAPKEALLPGPGLADRLRRDGITVAALPPSGLAVLPEAGLP